MKCWQRRWNSLKPDRVLSMLGIAAKAGSVASGEFSTEKAVKEGKAYLVIVAEDASDAVRELYRTHTKALKRIGKLEFDSLPFRALHQYTQPMETRTASISAVWLKQEM